VFSAPLTGFLSVATDNLGNLLVADRNGVHRISSDGTVTTLMNTSPRSIAVDTTGNVFIAPIYDQTITRISADGVSRRLHLTLCHRGGTDLARRRRWRGGFDWDGPATSAELYSPSGLAVDGAGNLFIADYNNYRVRRVSPGGVITTVVGDGAWTDTTCCFAGEGGPAANAALTNPLAVAVDAAGNV